MANIKAWTPDQLPDQTGKVFAITGANSGIGYYAAKYLAEAGAHILMLCRDPKRARQAAARIQGAGPDGLDAPKLTLIQMDLSDISSIHKGADEIKSHTDRLDGLINNAGLMMPPKRLVTQDGFEAQFGVNHLGHFLLSYALRDTLKAAQGRLIAVSSAMHKGGLRRIRFEDPNWQQDYHPVSAYAQSKLANALFIRTFNEKLRLAGQTERGYICHPGYAATDLQTKHTQGMVKRLMAFGNALTAQSADRGSWPLLLSASEATAQPGAYYGPTALFEMRGPVGLCQLAGPAKDDVAARQLWALSEEMLGIKWDM